MSAVVVVGGGISAEVVTEVLGVVVGSVVGAVLVRIVGVSVSC